MFRYLVAVVVSLIAGMLPVVGTSTFLLMISEQLRRQWEHAASTDHLTGLSNRRTLTDAGAIRIDQARREQFGLAVAIIDVDHFKSINDRFGHDVGDLALKHVAERLRAACRENDLPARQGGEEFVVIFSRADATQATAAAERIRQQLESTPFVGGPTPLTITASIGLAVMTQPDDDLDALIHRADEALYRAKHAGRNRVVLWSAPAAQPQAVPA